MEKVIGKHKWCYACFKFQPFLSRAESHVSGKSTMSLRSLDLEGTELFQKRLIKKLLHTKLFFRLQ